MQIKITNFKLVDRGALRAFFDIIFTFDDLGSIELKDCRLIRDKEKKPWASPPQVQYRGDSQHDFRYFPLVFLEGKIKAEFSKLAIEQYCSLLEGGKNNDNISRATDQAL